MDEHVWLSLRRAQLACAAMRDALCQADPSHAEAYQANYTAYAGQLQALDAEYQTMTETAERSTIVVADRFPFRYLAEDYGLTYYAAFPGCSAETTRRVHPPLFPLLRHGRDRGHDDGGHRPAFPLPGLPRRRAPHPP